MQFAKLAIFACLLVAVALAAESEKKEHHKSHNRNKDHHKTRSHKEAHHERNHKEGHHERKHKDHKESHERSHGSHLLHASRSHGHAKSERQAEEVPKPAPDCTCSAWKCPEPITPEPITPEPVTPDPITPEPVTPEPITPEPITPEPITPEPVTPEPITPEPVTPEPITPEPVTPEPVTPEPITPEPITPDPITPEPITPDPITPEPVTPEPVTPGPVTPGVDGNWELEIKISGNVSVKLIYNADLKFFGIYNIATKLAIIFDGKTGIVGIFNIETNAALIVNLSANLGMYIENAGDISGLFGANFNLEAAFKALLEITKNIKIDANSENAFKIDIFLKAVVEGKLETSLAVFKKISVGFAAYISALVNVKKQIAVYGVISIVIPVFVEINNISKGLLELLAAITINLGGKFEANIFALIQKKIEFDIAAGTVILGGITGAIRGVGSIFVSLDAALKAYINNVIIKQVTSGKVVTIEGIVTITTAIVAEGSWLITVVNNKINVGIFYDKAANVLGILNKKLNIAVVILSEGNLFGFINIATGGALVANYLTSNARIVTAVELKAAFNVDILLIGGAFAKAAAVIKANAEGLGNLVFAPKDSFNLTAVVAALTLSIGWEAAYNLIFIGNAAVKAAIDLHFKAFFVAVRAKLGLFGAIAKGGLALILPIAGSIKIVSEGFFNIVLGIFDNLKATFDAELMVNIFVDFNVSVVKYIRGEVDVLFGAVLKALNQFKGFVGSIFGAIKGVVNVIKQAHIDVDIDIGFGFGFGGTIIGGAEGGGGIEGGAGGEGGTGGEGGVVIGGGGSVGGEVGVGGGSSGGITIG